MPLTVITIRFELFPNPTLDTIVLKCIAFVFDEPPPAIPKSNRVNIDVHVRVSSCRLFFFIFSCLERCAVRTNAYWVNPRS